MHLVTDNHPSSIVVFGEAGHYRWFNKVALDLTGLSRQALFDKPITSVIGPAEGRKIERWVQDCLAAGKPMTVTHSANVEGKGERSEEHTSELQSLMRISYAVFCLNKKEICHKNEKTHV